MLDKSKILNSHINTKKIFVKIWEGDVLISELSVKEQIEIENIMFDKQSIDNTKIHLDMETFNKQKILALSYGIVNEDGSKMFTQEELEKLPSVNNPLDEIYNEIMEFNKPKK